MTVYLTSIGILVAIFIVGSVRPVNMGAVAFLAAFVAGVLVSGETVEEVLLAFPSSVFLVLVGVTYLFAIANRNGTVQWLLDRSVHVLRGRSAAIPWVFFGLSALFCAVGALPPAVAALLAPIAIPFAAAYRLSTTSVSVLILLGTTAGSFAPSGLLGAIVNGILETNDLQTYPQFLFAATFGVATAAAAGFMLVMSKFGATPTDSSAASGGFVAPAGGGVATGTVATRTAALTIEQGLTIVGFLAMIVATVGFNYDIGFLSISLAVVLTVLFPKHGSAAVKDVSWDVILLICGILTYVGVLQRNGTVQWIGESVAGLNAPLLAALLLCLIAGLVSAFASTTAMLAMLVPLVVPLIELGEVGAAGMIAALCISSSVVDTSPFSTGGAIMLANTTEADRPLLYKNLLRFAGAMVILGPLVSWAIFVAPGWS